MSEKTEYLQFEQGCNYSRQYSLTGDTPWPSSFQETGHLTRLICNMLAYLVRGYFFLTLIINELYSLGRSDANTKLTLLVTTN